ncbi:MAG: hypothetical protein Fur0027_13070 [Raineya sp.]
MKTCLFLIFFCCYIASFAQQKKPNNATQQPNKTNTPNQQNKTAQKKDDKKTSETSKKPLNTKINANKSTQKPTSKPTPKEPEEPKEPDYSYIKVDTTCPRCKGYKHDRACDGLYCYSGACSTCKGYKKCVHCAGTQMKNVGVEGCPDCTDGKCRTCKGSGLCAKCEGTGRLPCTLCGGTGSKSAEQIKEERLKKIEKEKRNFEERERKRLFQDF